MTLRNTLSTTNAFKYFIIILLVSYKNNILYYFSNQKAMLLLYLERKKKFWIEINNIIEYVSRIFWNKYYEEKKKKKLEKYLYNWVLVRVIPKQEYSL